MFGGGAFQYCSRAAFEGEGFEERMMNSAAIIGIHSVWEGRIPVPVFGCY